MERNVSQWDAFLTLLPSEMGEATNAIRCGGSGHLLLKGPNGEPVLLLKTHRRKSPRAPIRLKHIQITFEVPYRVTNVEDENIAEDYYCRFICDAHSASLHRYFVELLLATTGQFDKELSQEDIDATVDSLLEVFRQVAMPPQMTVSGLWGELFLIWTANQPESWVEAWHNFLTDPFDFVFESSRIEVKSTKKPTREHEFAMHQVRSGYPADYIASLMLIPSNTGKSVLDLADEIARHINPVLQIKLWSGVLATLGEDAESADDQFFDEKSASNSLIFIPTAFVPAPIISSDDLACISNVHYRAQLNAACLAHSVARERIDPVHQQLYGV